MAEDRWEREERYGRDIERAGGKQPASWNESVVICLPDAYHHLLVGSASQAAAVLQNNWSGSKSDPAYQAALTACLEAVNGDVPGYMARLAFEKAARDAGVLR
ncbi:DUF982 domain-containing protein [Ensifer sp. ENS12]|uniref:DUF982 domain-containing protein n=1 Tax=Ensifer sp. ENS12 TaxID=2854774 RepID=UPI001C492B07|nr:DUF982 domain-containing protein [Ensifer sp. ENS12]MBV7521739.1 DUF982 domain-containing protein [Ensifer sp. ENS12]